MEAQSVGRKSFKQSHGYDPLRMHKVQHQLIAWCLSKDSTVADEPHAHGRWAVLAVSVSRGANKP